VIAEREGRAEEEEARRDDDARARERERCDEIMNEITNGWTRRARDVTRATTPTPTRLDSTHRLDSTDATDSIDARALDATRRDATRRDPDRPRTHTRPEQYMVSIEPSL